MFFCNGFVDAWESDIITKLPNPALQLCSFASSSPVPTPFLCALVCCRPLPYAIFATRLLPLVALPSFSSISSAYNVARQIQVSILLLLDLEEHLFFLGFCLIFSFSFGLKMTPLSFSFFFSSLFLKLMFCVFCVEDRSMHGKLEPWFFRVICTNVLLGFLLVRMICSCSILHCDLWCLSGSLGFVNVKKAKIILI